MISAKLKGAEVYITDILQEQFSMALGLGG